MSFLFIFLFFVWLYLIGVLKLLWFFFICACNERMRISVHSPLFFFIVSLSNQRLSTIFSFRRYRTIKLKITHTRQVFLLTHDVFIRLMRIFTGSTGGIYLYVSVTFFCIYAFNLFYFINLFSSLFINRCVYTICFSFFLNIS